MSSVTMGQNLRVWNAQNLQQTRSFSTALQAQSNLAVKTAMPLLKALGSGGNSYLGTLFTTTTHNLQVTVQLFMARVKTVDFPNKSRTHAERC